LVKQYLISSKINAGLESPGVGGVILATQRSEPEAREPLPK